MNNNATTEITVTQSGTRYEDIRFDEKVTVPSGIQDVIFVNCHFTSLLNEGDNTAVISSTFAFSGIGIENSGRALAVRDCVLEGRGTAILSCGDGADIRSCRITVD